MFGIGGQELFVILVIALVVIGPKNLPGIAKTLGKAFGQFQRAADDLKREIDISAAGPPPGDDRGKRAPEGPPEKTTQAGPSEKPEDQPDPAGKSS